MAARRGPAGAPSAPRCEGSSPGPRARPFLRARGFEVEAVQVEEPLLALSCSINTGKKAVVRFWAFRLLQALPWVAGSSLVVEDDQK